MDLTPVTAPPARSDRALRLEPPLVALAYPAILWCGPRFSPVFVAASLVVPLLGLVAAARVDGRRAPRARAIAHLVVAAPPLFSLLGGWLDFQHAVPLDSLRVWIPLWSGLAVVAAVERPGSPTAIGEDGAIGGTRSSARSGRGDSSTGAMSRPTASPRRVAVAHGISAAVVTLFALPHLAIMTALRRVYRHSLVEPVVLAAVAFQVASGAWLLRGKLARAAGWLGALQTTSGAYLLVFFLSHVSAALRARVRGVDPNWNWLAGGELLSDPWSVRLVPYYFLAVVALGLHAGCGLHTVLRGHRIAVRGPALLAIVTGLAAVASALILIGLFRA
jgi:hypothetical protein